MRTENDREKQLMCQLFHSADRLQNLRIFYNETGQRKYISAMTQVSKDMRKVVDELSKRA